MVNIELIFNMTSTKQVFNILSFNCYGLKSGLHSISNLVDQNNYEIMFLCEHWLRASEIQDINSYFSMHEGLQVFLQI